LKNKTQDCQYDRKRKTIEAKNESKMTQGTSLSEPIAKPSPPKGFSKWLERISGHPLGGTKDQPDFSSQFGGTTPLNDSNFDSAALPSVSTTILGWKFGFRRRDSGAYQTQENHDSVIDDSFLSTHYHQGFRRDSEGISSLTTKSELTLATLLDPSSPRSGGKLLHAEADLQAALAEANIKSDIRKVITDEDVFVVETPRSFEPMDKNAQDNEDEFTESQILFEETFKNNEIPNERKKPGKLTALVMKSALTNNWFFKNSEVDEDEEKDSEIRSRKSSKASESTNETSRKISTEEMKLKMREWNAMSPQTM